MSCIGFRCSNKDYTYVILTGTKEQPQILSKGTVAFPKGFTRPQELKWFLQEVEELFKKNKITSVAIKSTEAPARKGNTYDERVENEAIILVTAYSFGIKNISKKVKSTIAKDLGLKGKSKYLTSKLELSAFPNYEKETDKMKEAILVAWSSM